MASSEVERSQPKAAGGSVSASAVRAVVALACVQASVPLMNTVVFPEFDATFTLARDLSVLANAVFLLVVGFLATFRPAALKPRAFAAGLVVAVAVGAAGVPAALVARQPVLLAVCASLHAIARGGATLMAGLALAELGRAQARVGICLAFVAASAVAALSWLVPGTVGFTLYLALPLPALWAAWPAARPCLDKTARCAAPADVAVTQPATFLPLSSQVFACLMLIKVAFGYALRIGELPLADLAALLAACAVAAAVWRFGRTRCPADVLARLAVLFCTAGFYLSGALGPAVMAASIPLFFVGNLLIEIVLWDVVVAVSARNPRAAVATVAWGRGVTGFGSVAGAALGVWSASAGSEAVPLLVSGVLLVAVVAYAFFGLRGFSFSEAVAGVEPVSPAVVEIPRPTLQARCDELAREHGLTPREREVFEMLARGRDRAFIQERLAVSRNTVKAHVKHVYAKLGIHSHQELIDLVEQGRSAR